MTPPPPSACQFVPITIACFTFLVSSSIPLACFPVVYICKTITVNSILLHVIIFTIRV